jgi:hypothetical protein
MPIFTSVWLRHGPTTGATTKKGVISPGHWARQASDSGHGSLDLFFPIVDIHLSYSVLWRMVVWIVLIFPVLDLQDGGDSLLTEGYLIPSGTADDRPLVQIKPVGVDGIAYHLSQG